MSKTSKIFYINSRNRSSGTNSDFHINLDMKGLNVSHAAVLRAYIPKSFYSVESGKNTFVLSENSVETTITIAPGSYSRSSLKNYLASILMSNSSQGWVYTISYASSTQGDDGKLTYTVSGNSGIQPQFIFTDYLWEQLGFEKNTTNAFTSDSLKSVNVINLQPENTLFLHSDICQDSDNILQEIYSASDLNFSGISFTNNNIEHYSKPLISRDNNNFRFYLTDENADPIDLNGQNVLITVLVYKKINWSDALKSFWALLSRSK